MLKKDQTNFLIIKEALLKIMVMIIKMRKRKMGKISVVAKEHSAKLSKSLLLKMITKLIWMTFDICDFQKLIIKNKIHFMDLFIIFILL